MCVLNNWLPGILLMLAIVYLDRVSSVLNRDTKQYGKQYLFDGNEETCWNSGQVQWVLMLLITTAVRRTTLKMGTVELCFVLLTSYGLFPHKQGLPQHITVHFHRPVKPTSIYLMFQGGFAGKICNILISAVGDAEFIHTGRCFFVIRACCIFVFFAPFLSWSSFIWPTIS